MLYGNNEKAMQNLKWKFKLITELKLEAKLNGKTFNTFQTLQIDSYEKGSISDPSWCQNWVVLITFSIHGSLVL